MLHLRQVKSPGAKCSKDGYRYPPFDQSGPGARFSKVPIINGPGKLSPFTLKIEVSIVLHLPR